MKRVLVLDFELPAFESLGDLTVSELKDLKIKLAPHYSVRNELEDESYLKICKYYLAVRMMIENIESGRDRWYHIVGIVDPIKA